ncbi:proline-rich protein PRCC [Anolis sagrei]|uniref:proline-rich protein PRCC n=1 Tax=Anolis sagrei TaxID=38937 RepID=UPI00351FD24F
MSLVAYASSEEDEAEDSEEEEEADEEEEPEGGPSKGLFSALPPPKGSRPLPPSPPPPSSEPGLPSRPRKRTQPVRIAAPQLGSGDSDSEEDEPAKKQPTSQGRGEGSGLSALLPQPKNLTVKETNRPLLPYVFSRKAAEKSSEEAKGSASTVAPSKPKAKPSLQTAASAITTTPSPSAIKAAAKSATLQVTKQITQEENESDEEVAPENYFSLPERREPPAPLGPEPFLFTATVVPDDLPPGTEPEDQDVSTAANAPLEFKTASGSSAASHGWAPKPGEEYGGQPYSPYPGYSEGFYGSGYYQETDPAPGPQQEAGSDTASATTATSSSSSSSFMDDEAFKRLQGKRNRGREEINFVEIKGDDQLSGAQQWLTKSLTEEQNMKSFSKKKGEQPTGQQRRKHQITYLIHQAKERELELKNTWAENKLSRRQTQAKYGF